jgi:hypothetical protein
MNNTKAFILNVSMILEPTLIASQPIFDGGSRNAG